MTEDTRAQERLTESARDSSVALDDLAAAARRADSTFNTSLTSLPRTLGDAVDKMFGENIAAPIRFFEARFQTLRQLTDFGVNFGFSMRDMESAANNARMSLSEMTSMAKDNSEIMGIFGESVSSGVQNFLGDLGNLRALGDAGAAGRELEARLTSLGFETEEVSNAFLSYNAQLAFQGHRDRITGDLRNRRAVEFAETLDELAQLTGKQRDALAEEALDVSREGDIMARARQLPAATADMLGETTAIFDQLGDQYGGLARDILGRGFARGDAVMVQAADEQTANLLYELRQAFETGNRERVEQIRAQVMASAGAFEDSEVFREMGVFTNVPFGKVVSEMGSQSFAVTERFRSIADELGVTLTDIEGLSAVIEESNSRFERTRETARDPDSMFNTMTEQIIAAERTNQTVRNELIDAAYETLAEHITDFGNLFGAGLERLENDIPNIAQTLRNEFSEMMSSMTGDAGSGPNQALTRGFATSDPEAVAAAAEISSLLDERSSASVERQREIDSRIDDLSRTINTIEVANAIINIEQAQDARTEASSEASRRLNSETEQPNSIGTLGNFGRLFRDFGTESLVPLHNIEAVMTPDQMGDLVQNSAMGMARSIVERMEAATGNRSVSAINSIGSSLQNQLASLQGSLNTSMRSVRDTVATGSGNEIDLSGLENEIRQLAAQMKGPFEDALNSALRPQLEQLVSYSRTTAESNNKIQKNIRSVGNDYMRGA